VKRLLAGYSLNPVGLGCMGLSHGYGTPPSPADAARVLHRALDLGCTHIDSARLYGAGRNEALIGETLAGRRQEYFLVSKMGIKIDGPKRYTDCSPARVISEVEESLRLLRTDHIDLYYLHRRDFRVPIEDSVGALADCVRAGKIGAIGLSEMSADTLRAAHAVHPVAAMQTEYSPWTRNVELGVLDTTRELGTALVAFSPLARGVLANGLRDRETLKEGDIRYPMPRFDAHNWPKNLALADGFNAIAAGQGVTPAQLSLAWVLSRGDHVHVIPGTTRIDHLEENLARVDWRPDDAVLAAVDALINQQTVAGHRYAEPMRKTIDTEDFPA
jgi:aryl-alcohol dehydrogenase-like predicted oxidoreductase